MHIDGLKLTKKDIQPSGCYGDIKALATHCGLDYRQCTLNGEWQHGWIPPERNFHPEWVLGCSGESRLHRTKQTYFVARKDQSQFLANCGYTKVRAIGHPIIYTTKKAYARIANSLLIMPSHSTIESSAGQDDALESYLQYIVSIRYHFEEVYACIHTADLDYYSNKFKSIGISVLEGSQESDQNSYQRMLSLGSQFEYMTTNYFGSHVAYLSYAGCKVSVAGPKPAIRINKLKELQFYQNAPFCLASYAYLNQYIEEAYSFFLANPWEALPRIEWAQEQLGEENKLNPIECREILASAFQERSKDHAFVAKSFLKKILPSQVKTAARRALSTLRRKSSSPNAFLSKSLAVQTHLTPEELTCMANYSKLLQPTAIGAEIGSYFGASALATCAGFRSENNKLYCIDTWMNNAMAYTDDELENPDLQLKDTFDSFIANTSICSGFIVPQRGWSHDVFPDLIKTGLKLDWLFIDGDHSYEGVKRDWELYSTILNSEALVIFHDTGWAEGVNQVIIESVMDCCILEKTLPNMKVYRYLGKPYWISGNFRAGKAAS